MPTAFSSSSPSGEEGADETRRAPALREFGRYTLLERLGSGGMAEVHLAALAGPFDAKKLVVLKQPHRSSETVGKMFLDEARLAMRLNHPNVVQTYDVGHQDGQIFLAMEYLDGQSLQKLLAAMVRENRDLPHVYLARIAADALSGLHYAHELRDFDGTPLHIVHRDVSPHNLFITYDGVVKVVDFGVAKATSNLAQTEAGAVKGKLSYMAPEHALEQGTDHRADVFAMGIVLWEMIAKQRLLTGATSGQVLNRLLHMPFPRLSKVAPGVDPALEDIVVRALERDPNARYQTALEMREALEEYIGETGTSVRMAEIGRFVSDLFAISRDQMSAKIRAHMVVLGARPPSGSGSASQPARPPPVYDLPDAPTNVVTTVRPQLTPIETSRAGGTSTAATAQSYSSPSYSAVPRPVGFVTGPPTPSPMAAPGSSPSALYDGPAETAGGTVLLSTSGTVPPVPSPMHGVTPGYGAAPGSTDAVEAPPVAGPTTSERALPTALLVAAVSFVAVILVAGAIVVLARTRSITGSNATRPEATETADTATVQTTVRAPPVTTGVLGASMNDPPPGATTTPANASTNGASNGASNGTSGGTGGTTTPGGGSATGGSHGAGSNRAGGTHGGGTASPRTQDTGGGHSARPIDTSFPGE